VKAVSAQHDDRLDALDVALLGLARANPRVGILELSRLASVARATVLARMEAEGIITGYGPELDLEAAGYTMQAFVTLEIAQGRLADLSAHLAGVPGVIEAYATTGAHDVLCRVAASSHQELQEVLLTISRSDLVVRSTSAILLSVVVPPRVLPLLESARRAAPSRAPAYRAGAVSRVD
jgi:DNA-binding Lrp family transcriptional regulator